MKKIVPVLSLFVVTLACSFAAGEEVRSLRGDAEISAGSNPAVGMDWQSGNSVIPRTFVYQPPLIPHSIEGFEIHAGTNDNDCLNCHGVEGSGVPKPHPSHYTDRDGKTGKNVSQRWFYCTQCHVGQVDAKPLVENTFREK